MLLLIVKSMVKISLLETTFKDHTLAWYMKFKSIVPLGVARSLIEIHQTLFKEFKKLKHES